MKSQRFHLDEEVKDLAWELEKIKTKYLREMRKKQAPLFKKIKELNAKASKLRYNKKQDPCPICHGTGYAFEWTENWRGKLKEKMIPCEYCEVS